MARLIPGLLALLLASCGKDGDSSAPPAGDVALSATDRAVRASMLLRGTRPTTRELDAVAADPGALDGLVDQWLDSPQFAETMKDLHAETFLLRRDTFEMLPALGPLEGHTLGEMFDAQVNEPLKLVEHVITTDRPYTDIVTTEVMFANEVIAKMYGVPWDPAGPEWQESRWADGRPAAGLLSSAEMLRRWESNGSNFNRARANMVASKLLCSDFDTRDIAVSGGIDVSDELAVSHAVMTEPSCIACHQTLDPLGAYFWGFMRVVRRDAVRDAVLGDCPDWNYALGDPPYGENHLPEYYCYPIQQYAPFAEDDWRDWDLREPGYFGTPARDLAEVGRLIADDPRFAQCTARHFYGWFAQVPPMEVPFEIAAELQEGFVASGFDAKALAKAAVLHDSLALERVEAADPLAGVVGLKVARPEQYARLVEDLTGYRWMSRPDPPGCAVGNVNGTQCWGDVDLMNSDLFGFRAMSGGVDGFTVTRPLHAVTPTKLLAADRLAQDAAAWVVDADLALPADQRRLLGPISATERDEAAVRAEIGRLQARILGSPGDSSAAVYLGLWQEIEAASGSRDAWVVVVATLLQDPEVWFY